MSTTNKPANYLEGGGPWGAWLLTHDHKRVALLYLGSVLVMLALGGAFALALRIELLHPNGTFMQSMTYNRLFTLHGVVMVWLFMIPAIPSAFGNFFLPLMLGAKDVAFPRLNLASWYIYVVGAVITLLAMLAGAADTGWTFYTPYSSISPTAVVPIVFGIFVVGWSTIVSGINFIVTVHTMRKPSLGWFEMPLFAWAIYATSIIQVLATPVLGLSLALVGLDHAFDWGLFDPARGGDPILYQHLFWFYSHPAVYIMILPAMGVISEVICTFSHKNPVSYRAIAYSSLGIAFVGFLTWGHHMFVAGQSLFGAAAFGLLSMFVSIFSAVKVFTWAGTLYKGAIWIRTPLLYAFAFLFLFVFGGMTGVAVATMSLDIHWHDTYFVVAHFHFIMVGATLTAFLAGLYYWFPKMTGRMYNERLGSISAALVFFGFFGTFFPQFLLGNAGMPRRYHTYPEQYQVLHVASTLGALVLGAGLFLTLLVLVHAWLRGAAAGDNPWASRSFEWRTASPPPTDNFVTPPDFSVGAYDYSEAVPHG